MDATCLSLDLAIHCAQDAAVMTADLRVKFKQIGYGPLVVESAMRVGRHEGSVAAQEEIAEIAQPFRCTDHSRAMKDAIRIRDLWSLEKEVVVHSQLDFRVYMAGCCPCLIPNCS